jgi:hypothetical protein
MQRDNPRTRRYTGTKADQIQLNIPIPAVGETITMEVERYNLTILVGRGAEETQEQKRARYTVVGPIAPDRRLHVARLGVGALKAKRMQVTVCSEDAAGDKLIKSGSRIDVSLDTVTCTGCVRTLRAEGVEIIEGNRT